MGHPNRMNGATPSLDVRISATLNSADVDKTALVSLLRETEAAIAEAQTTIAVESANALDLANPDPNTSDALVSKAQRTTARLEKALPKLGDRLNAIQAYESNQEWHARADVLRAARDVLAVELAKIYEPFLVHLTNLYQRIDANTAAISDLHRQAPAGANRRLVDAELAARGIDRYDAAHPRLRENLKLPAWDRSSEVAFPPDPMATWNRYAAQSHAALAQRMAEKGALTTGPDWAAGRDLAAQQEDAAAFKRDAELRAADTKSKIEYEAKVQEAERRRLGVAK